ncbi:hypothetical protein pdam_00003341 [Pocillopora damicornis]|uniref:Uncharacterized protein n=1 Tax=Pocillopora damicornis TaxID=46731 RepID=A0A3M6TAH7_POCDA|nr:hypothetical protein pdam_00003341 [Pocillopora damicornis]
MSVSDLLYPIFVSITSCSDARRWLRSTGTEHLHGPSSIAYNYVCNDYLLHLDNGNSLVLPNIIAHLRHLKLQKIHDKRSLNTIRQPERNSPLLDKFSLSAS